MPKIAPGKYLMANGYISIKMPDHPKSCKGMVYEHLVVAEEMNGGPLPLGAVVHHINRDRTDNRPENLVICKDVAEHSAIHARDMAMEACGKPDYRICTFCKQWDDPSNLRLRFTKTGQNASSYHKECARKESKRRYDAGLCVRNIEKRRKSGLAAYYRGKAKKQAMLAQGMEA